MNPEAPAPRGYGSARRALARMRLRIWTFSRALRLHRIAPKHVAIAATASFVFALFAWERCGVAGCPDVARLAAYQPAGGSVLLDRNDKPFSVLRPVRREVVALDALPDHLREAFIAIEDRRFLRHDGIDWPRVFGAALANLRAGNVEEGASTITMQLARNAFPDQLPATEQTLRRKLLEARVARDIEARFTKDEILELYLNHIYFGGGAHGVDAAAKYWFAKTAAELTLAESALLAAIVKAPANYDPRRHSERARERRSLVLSAMQRAGFVTAEEAERARAARLGVVAQPPFRGRDQDLAAYFADEIRAVLEERFGDRIYTSALRIHTTLDVNAQKAAEQELAKQLQTIERGGYGRFTGPRLDANTLERPEGSQHLEGAVVMLEAATGDVLAMVGGRDHRVSTYNRAVRSARQAGSAFKPFVYAAALAKGYPPSQLIADEPISIRLASNRSWEPENYDGGYYGVLTMREALVDSRNIPTVRLAEAVGLGDIAATARSTGITSDLPDAPSLALGAASVTPLEMTAAYATFANMGDAVQPRMIRWVESEEGDVLWQEGVRARQALDPAVAYILTDMLRDAVDHGTGAAVRAEGFSGPVAGKTGTTNDGRDVWFVGYTPDVVAGIWIGFDTPRTIMSRAAGGRLAAPIWGRMMRQVYREREMPATWRVPQTVVARAIDPASGRILAPDCFTYGFTQELFIASMLPDATCPRPRGARGFIASILGALGLGRDDDRARRGDDPRPGRYERYERDARGQQTDARTERERQRLEDVLGAPPLGGLRSARGRTEQTPGT